MRERRRFTRHCCKIYFAGHLSSLFIAVVVDVYWAENQIAVDGGAKPDGFSHCLFSFLSCSWTLPVFGASDLPITVAPQAEL